MPQGFYKLWQRMSLRLEKTSLLLQSEHRYFMPAQQVLFSVDLLGFELVSLWAWQYGLLEAATWPCLAGAAQRSLQLALEADHCTQKILRRLEQQVCCFCLSIAYWRCK